MAVIEQPALTVKIPITLRAATKADLPKLEWCGKFAHFRNLYRRVFRDQQLGRRMMLVADCNGFPVGQVFIQLNSGTPRVADGNTRAYLYSLRVMPMFQGNGIGTALIKEAESILSQRNFRRVTIAVAKNNPGARKLYERLNFQIFAEDAGRWNYLDHEGKTCYVSEPCWIMEKSLTV